MKISIDIPDKDKDRIINGFCKKHGYKEQTLQMPSGIMASNPETKESFVQRRLVEIITSAVRAIEFEEAVKLVGADVDTSISAVSITGEIVSVDSQLPI